MTHPTASPLQSTPPPSPPPSSTPPSDPASDLIRTILSALSEDERRMISPQLPPGSVSARRLKAAGEVLPPNLASSQRAFALAQHALLTRQREAPPTSNPPLTPHIPTDNLQATVRAARGYLLGLQTRTHPESGLTFFPLLVAIHHCLERTKDVGGMNCVTIDFYLASVIQDLLDMDTTLRLSREQKDFDPTWTVDQQDRFLRTCELYQTTLQLCSPPIEDLESKISQFDPRIQSVLLELRFCYNHCLALFRHSPVHLFSIPRSPQQMMDTPLPQKGKSILYRLLIVLHVTKERLKLLPPDWIEQLPPNILSKIQENEGEWLSGYTHVIKWLKRVIAQETQDPMAPRELGEISRIVLEIFNRIEINRSSPLFLSCLEHSTLVMNDQRLPTLGDMAVKQLFRSSSNGDYLAGWTIKECLDWLLHQIGLTDYSKIQGPIGQLLEHESSWDRTIRLPPFAVILEQVRETVIQSDPWYPISRTLLDALDQLLSLARDPNLDQLTIEERVSQLLSKGLVKALSEIHQKTRDYQTTLRVVAEKFKYLVQHENLMLSSQPDQPKKRIVRSFQITMELWSFILDQETLLTKLSEMAIEACNQEIMRVIAETVNRPTSTMETSPTMASPPRETLSTKKAQRKKPSSSDSKQRKPRQQAEATPSVTRIGPDELPPCPSAALQSEPLPLASDVATEEPSFVEVNPPSFSPSPPLQSAQQCLVLATEHEQAACYFYNARFFLLILQHYQTKPSLLIGEPDAMRKSLEFVLRALIAIYAPGHQELNTHHLQTLADVLMRTSLPDHLRETLTKNSPFLTLIAQANEALFYPETSRFTDRKFSRLITSSLGGNRDATDHLRQLIEGATRLINALLHAATPMMNRCPQIEEAVAIDVRKLATLSHPSTAAPPSEALLQPSVDLLQPSGLPSYILSPRIAELTIQQIKGWLQIMSNSPVRGSDPFMELTNLRNAWVSQAQRYANQLCALIEEPTEGQGIHTLLDELSLIRRLLKAIIQGGLYHHLIKEFNPHENNPITLAKLFPEQLQVPLPSPLIGLIQRMTACPFSTPISGPLGELEGRLKAIKDLCEVAQAIMEAPNQDVYRIRGKNWSLASFNDAAEMLIATTRREILYPSLSYAMTFFKKAL